MQPRPSRPAPHSLDQNTDRPLTGINLDKVFEEKASAKDARRQQLQACLDFLREGDTLHVHSIDRMARNLVDLLNESEINEGGLVR